MGESAFAFLANLCAFLETNSSLKSHLGLSCVCGDSCSLHMADPMRAPWVSHLSHHTNAHLSWTMASWLHRQCQQVVVGSEIELEQTFSHNCVSHLFLKAPTPLASQDIHPLSTPKSTPAMDGCASAVGLWLSSVFPTRLNT